MSSCCWEMRRAHTDTHTQTSYTWVIWSSDRFLCSRLLANLPPSDKEKAGFPGAFMGLSSTLQWSSSVSWRLAWRAQAFGARSRPLGNMLLCVGNHREADGSSSGVATAQQQGQRLNREEEMLLASQACFALVSFSYRYIQLWQYLLVGYCIRTHYFFFYNVCELF